MKYINITIIACCLSELSKLVPPSYPLTTALVLLETLGVVVYDIAIAQHYNIECYMACYGIIYCMYLISIRVV